MLIQMMTTLMISQNIVLLIILYTQVTIINCKYQMDMEKLTNTIPGCIGGPLGMEHGHIKDGDITASSTFDYHSVGPHIGRSRQDAKGGAWCPAQTISSGVREWLEINLHTDYRITATETMGRFGGGQGQEFAEAYQIEYWRQSSGTWHLYTNISGHNVLKGNTNTYLAHKQDFHPPIVASRVRFLPHSQHPRTVCMRVELYGCTYKSPVSSYEAPPGEQFSPHAFLEDIYDGEKEGLLFRGGLGLLSDGLIGKPLSFTEHDISAANGWVGWTNKKFPLELTFVFKSLQSIQEVNIVAYNMPDMGIEVFSSLLISVKGASGHYSTREKAVSGQKTDKNVVGPAVASFSLNNSLASEVKLFLHFAAKWIILSEVHFNTEQVKQPIVEYKDTNHNKEPKTKVNSEIQDIDYVQDIPIASSTSEPKNLSVDQGKQKVVPDKSSVYYQTYTGIGIGILGMAVLLLVFIIFIIVLQKNRHQIFSKHSIFKSPLTKKRSSLPIRDKRLRLSPMIYSVNTRHEAFAPDDDSETEEASMFGSAPCRLTISRQEHRNTVKNTSCGTLCEYNNFHTRDQPVWNSFGSTPLFNLPVVDPLLRAPPTSFSFNTNLKDPYTYGYATPVKTDTQKTVSVVSENFYAAADLFKAKSDSPNSINWGSFTTPDLYRNTIDNY